MLSVTAVFVVGFAGQAIAQAPAAQDHSTHAAPAAPAATPAAPAAAASGAAADVAAGLQVKDSTGATIGEVAEVTANPAGQQVAVIKMGADSFTVETSKLQVRDGAAHVAATEAQIRQLMGKPAT